MLAPRPAADALARPSLPAMTTAPSAAARRLLPVLEAGHPLDAAILRDAMTRAFGASDAASGWVWKDAYEAAEAAAVLFLARHGRAMRRNAGAGPDGPARMLAMLEAVAALEPSHTKRSEEQVRLQQFSTPLALAYAVLQAAGIRPGDVVLEPSAGTGMLAVMAACALGGQATDALHLNEIAPVRAGLLAELFPAAAVTRHNAEAIADRLPDCRPTVVLMNPPFSATPGVGRIRHDADLRHLRAAFAMLPPGGRLAAVTSAQCVPGDAAWTAGYGADIDSGIDREARAANAAELLDAVITRVPVEPVPVIAGPDVGTDADLFSRTRDAKPPTPRPKMTRKRGSRTEPAPSKPTHDWGPIFELAVETGPIQAEATGADADPSAGAAAGPYAPWRPGAVRIPGATAHPTPLVQSRRHGRRAASRTVLPSDAARAHRDGRAALRRPARKHRAGRRSPCPPFELALPHRLRLGDHAALRR